MSSGDPLTKISNSIFHLEFFQKIIENWHKTNWTQLDTNGFSWTFFPTHFRPNWTRLDFFLTRQNWFQLDINCWEITFPIGNIFRGEIYNWKKQNPTNSNSLKSNQLSPTKFPIGLSWSKIIFQLEIQYSNINQLTPTQYQLNPIHSNWISNWNELAILVRARNYNFCKHMLLPTTINLNNEQLNNLNSENYLIVNALFFPSHSTANINHITGYIQY